MTSLTLVDAAQREAVATLPNFDPARTTLAEFRQGLVEGLTALVTPQPVAFEQRHIPGPAGALRLLLYRPEGTAGPLPAILYAHGGGMIAGTPEMLAGAHRFLAQECGVLIVSVDYRLAPETPFPGGLEDVFAALCWLQAEASALGVDPGRISVMGDSGGGCLAAAVALLARDRGRPRPRRGHRLCPAPAARRRADRAASLCRGGAWLRHPARPAGGPGGAGAAGLPAACDLIIGQSGAGPSPGFRLS